MATSFADYKNDYIKNTIAAQKEAAAKELEAAYQKNLAALDAQQRQTQQQYDTSRNQAQAEYEQNVKNYDEYAAAGGINSGANAQARLAFGNQRQSGLSSLSQGEANALQTIAQNRTDTTNAYNANAASLGADYGAKEYDALYKAWQDEVARDQADRSYYYQMAMNEIQTGNTPSADTLSRAGMDASTAASMAALYGAQLSAKSSGGSSGGRSRRSSGGSSRRSSGGSGSGTTSGTLSTASSGSSGTSSSYNRYLAAMQALQKSGSFDRDKGNGTAAQVAANRLASIVNKGNLTQQEARNILSALGYL